MPIKEMLIPIDVEKPSEGVVPVRYSHQIKTTEDYLGIFDLRCPYIIVGIGQSGTSSPKTYFANCRFHQDLEYIIKEELGGNAEISAYGQFTHLLGGSGYNQLNSLGLTSPSVSQTSDKIVEQNLHLFLENIDPSFLKNIVYLTWTEKGIKRQWIYWKQKRTLEYRGIFDK